LITIGIDPHKRTHTAVAIDDRRRRIGELEIVASAGMTRSLLDWAGGWPERCWAVEGSDGPGKLLAQQLLRAGETVIEVPASLAARARLLRTGHGRKTDGIDAFSVAEIAATREDLRHVVPDGHPAVLRLLADRRDALCRQRRQAINRLHRHLRDLIPGGAPTSLSADVASAALARVRPATLVDIERKHVARQLVTEIRRIDKQLDDNRTRTRAAVEAFPTRLTQIVGISHVLAAKILGHTGPIERFPTSDAYANYSGTAPIEVSSGDAVRHRLPLWEPPAKQCPAHGCPCPAVPPRSWPRLLPAQDRRGQEQEGSHALPQAPGRQARLPATSRRQRLRHPGADSGRRLI
jgi:transposase